MVSMFADCLDTYDYLGIEESEHRIDHKSISIYIGIFVFVIGALAWNSIGYKNVCREKDDASTPLGSLEYLKENEKSLSDLKLYTHFNNGSYFVWNGIGRVYIDPNTSPYTKKINRTSDILAEYLYIYNYATEKDIQAFLNKYDFDYLNVNSYEAALTNYLNMSEEYECVYTSNNIHQYNEFDNYKEELGVEVPLYRLYKHIR